jgi:WD40 repeat protein
MRMTRRTNTLLFVLCVFSLPCLSQSGPTPVTASLAPPVLRSAPGSSGCSAAQAAETPCPMLVLLKGYGNHEPLDKIAVVESGKVSSISSVSIGNCPGEISHDGRFVALDSRYDSERGIYVGLLGGDSSSWGTVAHVSNMRRVTPVTTPEDNRYCVTVRWSRDDSKISYKNPSGSLHIVSADGTGDRALTGPYLSSWHSWSPDGSEIVFERGYSGTRLLFIVDMAGEIRPVTTVQDFGRCETWAPDWSPDGKHIAFTTCDGSLYTISPEGQDLKQMATGGTRAYSPRWSVDGEWILFLTGRPPPQLWRVRSNGESPAKIADLPLRGGAMSLGRMP